MVPLNQETREVLGRYFEKRTEKRWVVPEPPFRSQKRGPLSARPIRELVRKYARLAGLDGVSAHSLRYTFCKNLANQGVGLERIATLAGHESINTTRVYIEPGSDDLQEDVESISW